MKKKTKTTHPKTNPSPKHRTHKPPKKKQTTYKVANWKDYNQALVSRGSITLWLGEDAVAAWHTTPKTGKAGHPKTYSDLAIRTALTIQAVYGLPLRATEGFVSSLLQLMSLSLKSPDYSTVSYRSSSLTIPLSTKVKAALARGEPLHIAVDSTGVKVYGEGEWKVRKHGWSKHRTWRKVHLGVDVETNLIATDELTANGKGDGDSQLLPTLLEHLPEEMQLGEVSADGAYDTRNSYEVIQAKGATAIIPPRRGAKIWRHGNRTADRLPRDQALRRIRTVGRKQWKQETGYHQRSLSETAMFRLKTIFGNTLSSRTLDRQKIQSKIRIAALNEMTLRGMPATVAVPAAN